MKPREFYERFFMLRKCIGCKKILEYEERNEVFCKDCDLAWNVAKTESCKNCLQSAIECTCQPKELAKTGSLCLRKLIFYHKRNGIPPRIRMIYRLKHHPHKRTESFLSGELARLLREEIATLGMTDLEREAVIVSVPRSKSSFIKYGMDQSERVARELSLDVGVPYVKAIKRAGLFTKEQKTLTKSGRFKSVKKDLFIDAPQLVEGKNVFIYDDVVTTGASMTACSELLKKAGACAILCLCIAQN